MTSKQKRKSTALIVIAGLMFAGVSAQASGILNTPSGGYLVCVNSKTKVVTHPGKSECPKGNKKLVLGAQGPSGIDGLTGAAGLPGKDGLDGKTLWNGVKDPEGTLGAPGDMFINSVSKTLFGPKNIDGTWPAGVSIVGPAGAMGPQGPTGGSGPAGATGATGATGSNAILTCAQGGTCEIGDTGPGGGIVFIVQTASTAAPWRYMEAAPNTWSGGSADPSIAWCGNTSAFVPNLLTGDTTQIQTFSTRGSGFSNSQKMNRGCTFGAANAATAYNGGGKSDWHLPSRSELEQLYYRKSTVGGFAEDDYWTSVEDSASVAWGRKFDSNGLGFFASKGTAKYVRPVRAF